MSCSGGMRKKKHIVMKEYQAKLQKNVTSGFFKTSRTATARGAGGVNVNILCGLQPH